MNANFGRAIEILSSPLTTYRMETLPGVAPPEQQNTYFYIGQHETKRTVPVTTVLGNQAQDAGVSFENLPFPISNIVVVERVQGWARIFCENLVSLKMPWHKAISEKKEHG
jgi:hypothetical protein